jgi:SusD family.
MDNFYQISDGAHDRNKEIMLYADHTEKSEQYNGASLSYSGGGDMDNFAGWMMNWNYANMTAKADDGKVINPVLRTDQQYCGRPWSRMAPTQEAIATFIDRDKDSRYDGTFVYVFRTNWERGGGSQKYVIGPNDAQIGKNEAFLVYLDEEDPTVQYTFDSNISMLGVSANYDYYVVNPSGVSRLMYPKIWKLGPYRTNTSGTGQPNAAHNASVQHRQVLRVLLHRRRGGREGRLGQQVRPRPHQRSCAPAPASGPTMSTGTRSTRLTSARN